MSHWRQKAIETFPQLHQAIADAESAAWVWDVSRQALQDAYRRNPLNEKFVGDVYEYASWCLHHRSRDVRNAVIFWFYEGLCADSLLRPDMARWISQADFDCPDFGWGLILTDKNWLAFQQEFSDRKAEAEGRASRNQRNKLKREAK